MFPESNSEPLTAVHAWARAFNAGDLGRVVEQYAPDAVLWGTFAQEIITTREGLVEYFDRAFQTQPRPTVELQSVSVQVLDGFAVASGAYLLRFAVNDHVQSMPARFTFALSNKVDHWTIVSHHSSAMPVNRALGASGH